MVDEANERQRTRFCIKVLCGMAVVTALALGITMAVREHYGPLTECYSGPPWYRSCR